MFHSHCAATCTSHKVVHPLDIFVGCWGPHTDLGINLEPPVAPGTCPRRLASIKPKLANISEFGVGVTEELVWLQGSWYGTTKAQ